MIWIVIFACLAISFIFSGIESSVLSVNRLRLRHHARMGDRPALQLEEMLQHVERLMITVVLVTSMTNILAIALIFQTLKRLFGEGAAIVGIVIATPLLVLIMEFLPKAIFQRFPYRALVQFVKILGVTHLILRPFVVTGTWFFEFLTRGKKWRAPGQDVGSIEDIRRQLRSSSAPLSPTVKQMIDNVLEFRNLTAANVMVPLSEVTTIAPTASVQDLFALAKKTDFERIPVATANGEILGLLQLVDFLSDGQDNGPAIARMRRIVSITEQEPGLAILQKLRAARLTLALVTNPSGKPLGIVASEDLIRRLLTGKSA